MSKLLSLFVMLLAVVPHSIEQENFMTKVNECYDEYIYAISEEIEFGDVMIAFGKYKKDYYISAFCLSESSLSPNIYIYINDKLYTCVSEGTIGLAYGFKVKENDSIKIVFGKEPQTKTYELSFDNLMQQLQQEPIEGKGSGDFPENKRESYILSILKFVLIGFAVFCVLLIILLIFIIKRGKSIFSKKIYYNDDYDNYNNSQEFEDKDVVDTTFEEVQDIDRQALMDKYFEEYRCGDITEEELNEKLKKLWWKND